MFFSLSKRKPTPEEMRNEVIRLIDESKENVYKVVFYSQPEVLEILERVSRRWEESNYRGRPIDYATPSELKTLYKVARKVASQRAEDLVANYGEDFAWII